MSKRAYPLIRKAGFHTVDLGGGYAYCKDLPAAPGSRTVPSMVYFSAARDCGDGRVKDIDEQCIVYLDMDGKQSVKAELVQDVPAALALAQAWAEEATRS